MTGEFFVCDVEAIDADLLLAGPQGSTRVAANGLTPVAIARLGLILGAGEYSEMLAEVVAEHRESETGESGVFALPQRMQARLDAVDIPDVAARWAATDELSASQWDEDRAAWLLFQLRELVHGHHNKPVWYWWST